MAEDVLKYDDASGGLGSVNLAIKNPNSTEGFEHLPSEQLAADILDKEQQIIAIMEQIKSELEGAIA